MNKVEVKDKIEEALEKLKYKDFVLLKNEFLSLCDSVISLSNLTFAHKIATLILSEQIFRSLSIINNHPYHK